MADEDQEFERPEDEIAKIDLPERPTLPLPPEVKYTRPTIGGGTPGHPTTYRIRGAGDKGDSDTSGTKVPVGMGVAASFQFGSSVVAGLLIGTWIDKHWHTQLGMPIMTIAGFGVGIYGIIRMLGRYTGGKNK